MAQTSTYDNVDMGPALQAVQEAARNLEVAGIKSALLTYTEVAEHLRIHRTNVGRMVKAGIIPAHYVGSRPRIRRSDLIAYIDSCPAPSPMPT